MLISQLKQAWRNRKVNGNKKSQTIGTYCGLCAKAPHAQTPFCCFFLPSGFLCFTVLKGCLASQAETQLVLNNLSGQPSNPGLKLRSTLGNTTLLVNLLGWPSIEVRPRGQTLHQLNCSAGQAPWTKVEELNPLNWICLAGQAKSWSLGSSVAWLAAQ